MLRSLLRNFSFFFYREVDSVEGKQNKYEVSFTSSQRRSDYIFFFCDSKINLFKKRKRIKHSTENIIVFFIHTISFMAY